MTDLHERIRDFWDRDAAVYDTSASHALSDPVEAAAWRAALRRHLPEPGGRVLDVGAGTGSLSLLAVELGYRVTALDLSAAMLDRATEKARARGLELETVVAPAQHPPDGPFDAVMERHLLWTAPEPVETLRAWRDVASAERLVLFEGLYSHRGRTDGVRHALTRLVRKARGVEGGHHGSYDDDVIRSLPLANAASPGPLIDAVVSAGWKAIRIERLRDVEWARRMASGGVLGWLEAATQFAVVADA